MGIELLVVVFGLVFPGAAALRMWDFIGRHDSRTRLSLLSLGAFLGILPYAVLQVFGFIDLRNVLVDGSLHLPSLLSTGNLLLFVGITTSLVVVALAAARRAFSDQGQNRAAALLGRTLGGSNFSEVTDGAAGRWVNVKTSAGDEWMGVATMLPDMGSGHLKLDMPEYFDGEKWLFGNDFVVLPIASLEYILVLRREGSDGEDREQKGDKRGKNQEEHPGQSGVGGSSALDASTVVKAGNIGDTEGKPVYRVERG